MPEQNSSLSAPDCVLASLKAPTLKRAYQLMAIEAGSFLSLPESEIYEKIMNAELRETSGVGNGVAIPHIRLPELAQPFMMLVRLAAPVDADARDGTGVDLIFLLASPEGIIGDHLSRLSRISRLMRDDGFCQALRAAPGPESLLALFNDAQPLKIAA